MSPLRVVLALAFAACSASAQILYVDPVRGVDLTGAGSATQPFRSLTYAIAHASGPAPVFRLRRGVYGVGSGESFPIRLPDLCRVEAAEPRDVPTESGVRFDCQQPGIAALEYAPAAAGAVRLAGLTTTTGAGGDFVHVRVSAAAGFAVVELDGCRSDADSGLLIDSSAGGSASVVLTGCLFRGAGLALAATVASGVTLQLQVDRSDLEGGEDVVRFDATQGGLVLAGFRATQIRGGLAAGLRARTGPGPVPGGDVAVTLEHCLLYGNGHGTATGVRGAALVAETRVGGNAPTFRCVNGIFAGNANDTPIGGVGCQFGANLVSQSDLQALGGNLLRTPGFVDAAGGDFRLLPGSAGIDLAWSSDTTLFLDRDGEPRGSAGVGQPDLGPDEFHLDALHTAGRTTIGSTWQFALTTDPGLPFALLVGSDRDPLGFGAGQLHLRGVWFATPLGGMSDPSGLGRVSLPVPNDLGFLGIELDWQAVVARPPYFGTNAWPTVVGL
ncbi:MAG: DUF1565 domain-containing protein [Planctomycetes bacterium]|nr:DUF1565 domain-containing protein [Planctomycetota bacterium]